MNSKRRFNIGLLMLGRAFGGPLDMPSTGFLTLTRHSRQHSKDFRMGLGRPRLQIYTP
jgi:hypothetical protein